MKLSFTQEEGKNLPQYGQKYQLYLEWLQQTYGEEKAAFIHYLHRYYQLTWDEYWVQDQEDRWKMANTILDRLADIGGVGLPEEIENDLEGCSSEM